MPRPPTPAPLAASAIRRPSYRRHLPREALDGSADAARWNRRHPPGTPVQFDRGPRKRPLQTETSGAAWTLSTGTVVVPLRGVWGSVRIDRVRVMQEGEI